MTMKMKTTNNIPPTDPAMMKILVEEAKTKEMCSIQQDHIGLVNRFVQLESYVKMFTVVQDRVLFQLSLNVFPYFDDFNYKNICHHSKRVGTNDLLCLRPGCYHSTSKTHVRDRIFKSTLIHASVIYQIPEFAEFTEF